MRKNFKARVICLAVAGVMLTGSLALAAINGSPYQALRDATLNAMLLENATIDTTLTVDIDGLRIESQNSRMIFTQDGSVNLTVDEFGEITSLNYEVDGLRINTIWMQDRDTIQWYSANLRNTQTNPTTFNSFGNASTISGFAPEDFDSAMFRFGEMLFSLIVGDLKHNLYITNQGGHRHVSGAITHNQLPELIQLGIEAAIESSHNFNAAHPRTRADYLNPLEAPMSSFVLDRAYVDSEIDSSGNLIYLRLGGSATITTIFGDSGTAIVSAYVRFSDIGTSVVKSPIPGAAELFTPEFMEENFGRRYNQTVHFTLNADGTINLDSLTTRWPDAQMRGRVPLADTIRSVN